MSTSWPITNPTYGTYQWLLQSVGMYLGYNPDPAIWTHEEAGIADWCIQNGMMRFYYPQPIDMQRSPHEWTFLRPVLQITTTADVSTYDLPADFERIDGEITYPDDAYDNIPITSEERLRQLRDDQDSTSAPMFAAVVAKASDGTAQQTQQLIFYPTPDAEYRLQARYHAIPRQLSESHPYPLGGVTFAEAIKAACLAEAELKRYNARGEWNSVFLERLSAAIGQDCRRAPALLGYNLDAGMYRGKYNNRRDWLSEDVTYGV